MLKFFVFVSRSKTTHIASFLFSDSCFSAAHMAKISLLALTRQPPCFACALQLPTFLSSLWSDASPGKPIAMVTQ